MTLFWDDVQCRFYFLSFEVCRSGFRLLNYSNESIRKWKGTKVSSKVLPACRNEKGELFIEFISNDNQCMSHWEVLFYIILYFFCKFIKYLLMNPYYKWASWVLKKLNHWQLMPIRGNAIWFSLLWASIYLVCCNLW